MLRNPSILPGIPPAAEQMSGAIGIAAEPHGEVRRVRLEAQGTVQGVGFRPYVHRLATESGLAGWVRNGPAGVVIEIEGASAACERFLERFPRELPPLARVETLTVRDLGASGEVGFRIATTQGAADRFTLVAPDIATCPACLAELNDHANRRFGYAFTNCTNCGPRFTLIRDLPCDRPNTTMAAFALCPDCRREYEDPKDRRFHAEPTACPTCGPRLTLWDPAGRALPGDPLVGAVAVLRGGGILAVKGLGGFHLACDAANSEAVARLRRRKAQEQKPLAVMVPDLAAARALTRLTDAETDLLNSPVTERNACLPRSRRRIRWVRFSFSTSHTTCSGRGRGSWLPSAR